MSGDPYRKVQPGQRLKIPAPAWNACLDAAADFRSRQLARGAGAPTGGDLSGIRVRNDTGGDLAQFSVVRLDGVVIAEATSHEQFAMGPIFKAVAPTAGCFVAVLQEPIRKDGIGRALVHGLTPVQVAVTASTDVWAATTTVTGKLTSGPTGNCRIACIAGTTGDQWAVVSLNESDQRVAVDAGNDPRFLAESFNDTGTKAAGDLVIRRDDLQGTKPGQKVRLYARKSDLPSDWDEKVATDAGETAGYLKDQFNDTDTASGSDVLVYRDVLQGTTPNKRIRLFVKATSIRAQVSAGTYIDIDANGRIDVDLTEVSGYDGGKRQYLMHDASGAFQWIDAGNCSS